MRRRSSEARIAYGSNETLGDDALECSLHSPLRREERVLLQALAGGFVARHQFRRQLEAADADDLEERLQARFDSALFPARDDGTLAAATVGKLLLR